MNTFLQMPIKIKEENVYSIQKELSTSVLTIIVHLKCVKKKMNQYNLTNLQNVQEIVLHK